VSPILLFFPIVWLYGFGFHRMLFRFCFPSVGIWAIFGACIVIGSNSQTRTSKFIGGGAVVPLRVRFPYAQNSLIRRRSMSLNYATIVQSIK
jgi:hypothetical protein